MDRNKILSIEKYFNKIRSYLENIINDLTKSYKWKIHLAIAINFFSFKDTDEERVIHSKSDNIEIITLEIMTHDKTDKVIEEPFQSLLSRYQFGLETSMKGSDFIFDCGHLLY